VHFIFFFFQAEDGIRDKLVTGVQTCALPISDGLHDSSSRSAYTAPFNWTGFYLGGHGGYANSTATGPDLSFDQTGGFGGLQMGRSEERRVGKECRWGWGGWL